MLIAAPPNSGFGRRQRHPQLDGLGRRERNPQLGRRDYPMRGLGSTDHPPRGGGRKGNYGLGRRDYPMRGLGGFNDPGGWGDRLGTIFEGAFETYRDYWLARNMPEREAPAPRQPIAPPLAKQDNTKTTILVAAAVVAAVLLLK
jgi:hypothetical protein